MVDPAPDRSRQFPDLPYDPEEWERRLAAARARREKVLQQRAEGQQRTADAPEPGRAAADADGPEPLRLTIAVPNAPGPHVRTHARPAGRAQHISAVRTGSLPRIPAGRPHARPTFRPPAGRLLPALFGLIVGCVAGASLAGFGGIGPAIAELRSRLVSLSPVAVAPSSDTIPDAAPSYAAAPSPSRLPARRSIEARDPPAFPAMAPVVASAPIAALAAPARPGALSPALPLAAPVAGRSSTIFSAPSPPEISPVQPHPGGTTPVSDRAVANAGTGFSAVPPSLAVPQAPVSAFSIGETMPSPQRQASRLVVHAPERMAQDRREALVSQLADWPAEETVTSPYTVSETHVRYYHERDRAAARELATLFDTSARDFTSYSPSPDEGLLELWLAGQGAPRQDGPVGTHAVAGHATTSALGVLDRIANVIIGTSGGENRGPRRDGYAREPSSATAGGGAGSARRSASSDGGRASPGGGRQTGSRASGGDRSRAGSGASSGDPGASASGGGGGNRGNGGGPGKSGDRGNGGERGGSAADGGGGGNGNNGRGGGNGGGTGGNSDRGGNGGGGGKGGGRGG